MEQIKIQIEYYIQNNNVLDIINVMDIVEEKIKLLNIKFNIDNVIYNQITNTIYINGGRIDEVKK